MDYLSIRTQHFKKMRKRERVQLIRSFRAGASVEDLKEIYKITRYQVETILRRHMIEIEFSDFEGEFEDEHSIKSRPGAQSIL